MKEKIFNNFSLKILSAICAVVLWAVIVNIYDPNTGITMSNIPVQLINTEALTDNDYSYEVVDGGKISVYVSGPKSVVTDIKNSDIVATADLSQISTFADYVDIDVKVVKDGVVLNNLEVTPKTTAVKLNIENRVTQNIDLSLETTGELAEGYVITDQSISPNSIKLTGPSSSISKVVQAKAIYNISNASDNISDKANIILYDAEGNVISDPKLTLSKDYADYSAVVSPSKQAPVRFNYSGPLADGYYVTGVDIAPEQVTIAGNRDVLDKISELVIPSSALDLENVTSTKSYRIWLSDYKPEGITIVSDTYVTITVNVSNANIRELEVKPSDISMNGTAQGLTAKMVSTDTFKIRISGTKDVTDPLSTASLKPSVNLDKLGEGDHDVSVSFTLPNGCTLAGTYTVRVNLSTNQTQPASTQPQTQAVSPDSSTQQNNG